MPSIVAIILARVGSKSIPNKNIVNFCGKPLIVWSIEHAKKVEDISSVWVSSDSKEILEIAEKNGANIILRPKELSSDLSTSEEGWIHAINEIKNKGKTIDLVVALQATSPVRESPDIERGLNDFKAQKCDSMFSASVLPDLTIWEHSQDGEFRSVNFDYKKRSRRQDRNEQFIENGSFYIFKPDILIENNNRFGGKIGITKMEFWKSFEIDDSESLKMCEILMNSYLLKNDKPIYLEKLFSLDSKVAIVTGAAKGNGKAIAESLLRAGATVVLVDILKEELSSTVDAFKTENLKAFKYNCDITNFSEILGLRDFIVKQFNRIDILVNNAGVTFSHDSLTYPDEFWDKTYKVNLKAPFDLSRELAKIMREKGSGSIINITTIGATLGFPDNPAYGAFKGALRHLTKMLALDFGKYGVRVNNVAPGYMRTDMTRKSWDDQELRKKRTDRTILGRWGESSDLGGAVLFLASEASSYVTGLDLYVDGGWAVKGL